MSKVKGPLRPDEYPDRFMDCQEALAAKFHDLLDGAIEAGWSEHEVLAAVIEMADNRALAHDANSELQQLLVSVKRSS
ncbi:hypothetical protein [Rhizobium sp. RM]|uniref:hypothetical protein n=1 Tax=Rhizobium sp. RM TaxID=2748079 RepID=UPI00110E8DEC|nr:hypothetical protein [Rhizobium sp. RM]NWJ25397.1 hypothetical protein [Rhizobium sp. RM]TMV17522.1 hypothetical protein BJG94_16240 [Rhizobium sp. Td3]